MPPRRVARAISVRPATGIVHEVHDELGERRIERVVLERERLGGGKPHLHARMARPRGLDERLGGVDCGDVRRAEPLHELGRERTGSAPDVEDALPSSDVREVGQQRGERRRVPRHESVVSARTSNTTAGYVSRPSSVTKERVVSNRGVHHLPRERARLDPAR
jgi:hypothetical protein